MSALVVAGLVGLAACSAGVGQEPRTVVLRNGTLIDGTGRPSIEDAVVIVRAGTLEAVGRAADLEIPEDARTLDAGGGFILPGFIDAHVHFSQTGWFDGRPDALDLRDRHPYPDVVAGLQTNPERFGRAYLCSGITAVFDVGGYPWTRQLETASRDASDMPRVVAAGPLLATVDFWLNLPNEKQFIYMSDEATVRETVRSHASQGSSAVKIWFIMPAQPPDSARVVRLVRAAGEEAADYDLRLIVHATGLWEAKEAIRAGADVLVHSVYAEPVDQEFLHLAKENGVVYTPTLTVMEGYRNAFLSTDPADLPYPSSCIDSTTYAQFEAGIPTEKQPAWTRDATDLPPPAGLETALNNLGRVHDAGVTVATGTDAGNPGTVHGPSIYREMGLMARAGLSPMDVLIASTRNAARAMGREDDLGTLEPGKLADVVVLGENPLNGVEHFESVQLVMKGGEVVWDESD